MRLRRKREASNASAFPIEIPRALSAQARAEEAVNGQKWRTGCEGRISVVKRRHGLDRCRYKGSTGMKRWVGLGVVADNLINIGRVMESSHPNSNTFQLNLASPPARRRGSPLRARLTASFKSTNFAPESS